MEPLIVIVLIFLAALAVVFSAFVVYAGILQILRRRSAGEAPPSGDESDDSARS